VVERAYLVAVEPKDRRSTWPAEESLHELAMLADTAGAVVVGRTLQRAESPHVAHYVGKGKLQDIVALRSELDYNVVIFDDELSPTQQRNLENALKVKVIDRTALILHIFAARAQTREGQIQVELAQHEYLLPRLAGQWQHLERMEGAIGSRGPGETQLETDRRLIRGRIKRLKQELEGVSRHRELYRRRRQRSGIPVVALVGYTNAGKSTLMRALSGADVLVEDRLFATLDPVTRKIRLGPGGDVLVSDTVGFIQKLPTHLVAAFRATLEELAWADLLLHVVDVTHPAAAEQSQTVEDTLRELGVDTKPRITVLNKVDLLQDPETGAGLTAIEQLGALQSDVARHYPNAVLVSAARGWNLEGLKTLVSTTLASTTAGARERATGA
jgi:GTP-binding protein HflX